jgi:hypothetical protein
MPMSAPGPEMPGASTGTRGFGSSNSFVAESAAVQGTSFGSSMYAALSAPLPIDSVLERGERLDSSSLWAGNSGNGNQQDVTQEDSVMELDDIEDSDGDEEALMESRKQLSSEFRYQYKERTREYCETNYLSENIAIAGNGFWLDYLRHASSEPFLSEVISVM